MLFKTDGIVLNISIYDDKKSFVHIFTEDFGLVSYSIPNTHSKRSKLRRSLFTPFTILEMDVTHHPDRSIQKINEARVKNIMMELYADPIKNGVTLFLAEFLSKAIKPGDNSPALFRFIVDSANLFDLMNEGKANFHLLFLLKITEFLGFRINRESYSQGAILDLMEGRYAHSIPPHPYYLSPELSYEIHYLTEASFTDLQKINISRDKRNEILDILLQYYTLHIPAMKKVKSVEILKTLFS